MAQVKISELPSASSLTGSEVLPIVQGGSTLGATVNQIKDKIQASTINVLKMNASSVQTLANIGELAFNPDTQTLEVKCSADVTLSIGQENYIRGKNAESSTILNGTVVYVSGGLGANSLIKCAGNADGTAERVIGVATQDIGANNIGFITTSGIVNKLNTSAYIEGDLLWLGTNGAMTNVKPDTSVDQICIGVVLRSHAMEGSILVAVKDDWRDKLAEVRSDLNETTDKLTELEQRIFESSLKGDNDNFISKKFKTITGHTYRVNVLQTSWSHENASGIVFRVGKVEEGVITAIYVTNNTPIENVITFDAEDCDYYNVGFRGDIGEKIEFYIQDITSSVSLTQQIEVIRDEVNINANSINQLDSWLKMNLVGGNFPEINITLDDLTDYELHEGALSSNRTWVNINSDFKHIVIPIEREGTTLAIKVDTSSPQALTYACVTNYKTPILGDTYYPVDGIDGRRTLNIGIIRGALAVPNETKYVILNVIWGGQNVVLSDFNVHKNAEYYEGSIPKLQEDVDAINSRTLVGSRNILDVSAMAVGQIKNSNGGIGTSTTYKTSDYIPVKVGDKITFSNGTRQYIFFDESKVAISSTYNSTNDSPNLPLTIMAEQNGYLRMSMYAGRLTKGIAVYGETLGEYEPYYATYPVNEEVKDIMSHIEIPLVNLFIGEVIENKYYDDTTGNLVDNAAFCMYRLNGATIKNGDIITYSDGYQYYGNQSRFNVFANNGTYLKTYGSTMGNPIRIDVGRDDIYVLMRTRMQYDKTKFIASTNGYLTPITIFDKLSDEAKKPTQNKTINCLGDSFTEPAFSWVNQLAIMSGAKCNNYGKSSSRVSIDTTTSETDAEGKPIQGVAQSFLNRYSSMDANADVTIIFGGINDSDSIYRNEITLGNMQSALDDTTFYGALRLLIESIKLYMPAKKIFGVVPPDFAPTDNYVYLPNVQDACREIYSYYGIPYVDLKRECQEMYEDDFNNNYYRTASSNNWHPNEKGHRAIAVCIKQLIERFVV